MPRLLPVPLGTPLLVGSHVQVNPLWQAFFIALVDVFTPGFAPSDAPFVLTTAAPDLTDATNLGALASGFVKSTVAAGESTLSTVASIAPTDISGSGTYTPTLTIVANLNAVTAYACQYCRVGDMVIVSGKCDVNPDITATSTQLGISLPVASNFATAQQCGGTAFSPTIAAQGAGILADTVNDRAQMQWVAGDVSNQPMTFLFAYRVI